jgi:hypothetical protein
LTPGYRARSIGRFGLGSRYGKGLLILLAPSPRALSREGAAFTKDRDPTHPLRSGAQTRPFPPPLFPDPPRLIAQSHAAAAPRAKATSMRLMAMRQKIVVLVRLLSLPQGGRWPPALRPGHGPGLAVDCVLRHAEVKLGSAGHGATKVLVDGVGVCGAVGIRDHARPATPGAPNICLDDSPSTISHLFVVVQALLAAAKLYT